MWWTSHNTCSGSALLSLQIRIRFQCLGSMQRILNKQQKIYLHMKKTVLRIRIRKDPKLLPSRIQFGNKLISRIRIRIRNYHWGSGLLKTKCSDKNTIFNMKSSTSAQKWPLNVHSDYKCENFTKISVKDLDPDPDLKRSESRIRIWIRIRNYPPGRIRIRN